MSLSEVQMVMDLSILFQSLEATTACAHLVLSLNLSTSRSLQVLLLL